jgi:ABC-type antimicrobial peptide transport system permease subunit
VPRRFVTVALKSEGDPLALSAPLRAAVRALDPDAPLYWVRTHEQAIAHGRSTAALIASLFTAVGAVALALAAAGTYGVIAGAVARREREIGVRRALGADGAAVLRAVATPTLICVGLGLGVGMLLAVPLGRALAGLAPGVLHADPLTLLAVLAAVVTAAALGLGAPLARALRIEPAVALREE